MQCEWRSQLPTSHSMHSQIAKKQIWHPAYAPRRDEVVGTARNPAGPGAVIPQHRGKPFIPKKDRLPRQRYRPRRGSLVLPVLRTCHSSATARPSSTMGGGLVAEVDAWRCELSLESGSATATVSVPCAVVGLDGAFLPMNLLTDDPSTYGVRVPAVSGPDAPSYWSHKRYFRTRRSTRAAAACPEHEYEQKAAAGGRDSGLSAHEQRNI